MACCWTAAKIRFACQGNGTAVFCTGKAFAVPPELEAGTYRVEGAGYDGQFYRYLAHDPFFSKGYAAKYIDAPRMRSRRILVPFIAYLVGFGQTNWIDASFFVVEMLFLFLGVYWTAILLAGSGRSPWWGLLFVYSLDSCSMPKRVGRTACGC